MSIQPRWLEKYYGKDWMEKLSPTIQKDGRDHAIVRVTSGTSLGYVLVKKSGHHGVTAQESLHEGVPTEADWAKMEARLIERDR